jgi:hypothetical protein
MSGIICAIRGGPASRPTIQKSIQLAVETGLPLYLLFIVNLDFLTHTTSSRIHRISKDIREMGEFILWTAQEEALAKGISAEAMVRQGNVLEEIVSLCQELKADYVILGKPQVQPGKENVFNEDRLDQFRRRIETQCSAQTILA